MGSTKHGLLVALLPNQSVRRSGCSSTSIARTRPFVPGDPSLTAVGDSSIEDDSIASLYPEAAATMAASSVRSSHDLPNETVHDDWVGDDDKVALAAEAQSPSLVGSSTSFGPEPLAAQMPEKVPGGTEDLEMDATAEEERTLGHDVGDGAAISKNSYDISNSNISRYSSGNHSRSPGNPDRRLLEDTPQITASDGFENNTSNTSNSDAHNFSPSALIKSQPERNLLVAHCRDLSLRSGGRASLLTQVRAIRRRLHWCVILDILLYNFFCKIIVWS